MNLCIKCSDFNTAGMFLLGVNSSHHTREGEFSLKSSKQREQDDGGVGVCEAHLSHGYIRNTPSDTEAHAEQQLRADRRT